MFSLPSIYPSIVQPSPRGPFGCPAACIPVTQLAKACAITSVHPPGWNPESLNSHAHPRGMRSFQRQKKKKSLKAPREIIFAYHVCRLSNCQHYICLEITSIVNFYAEKKNRYSILFLLTLSEEKFHFLSSSFFLNNAEYATRALVLLSESSRLTFDEKWNNVALTGDKNRTFQWNSSRDRNVDSCCREFFSAILKIDLISPTDIRAQNRGKTFPPRFVLRVLYRRSMRGMGVERGVERGLVRFNASHPQWFNRSYFAGRCGEIGVTHLCGFYYGSSGYESTPSLGALFRELLNLRIRVPQRSSARARSGTCMRKQGHCSLFSDEFLPCCDPFVDQTWSFARYLGALIQAHALRGPRNNVRTFTLLWKCLSPQFSIFLKFFRVGKVNVFSIFCHLKLWIVWIYTFFFSLYLIQSRQKKLNRRIKFKLLNYRCKYNPILFWSLITS